jgi:hypothetical protein
MVSKSAPSRSAFRSVTTPGAASKFGCVLVGSRLVSEHLVAEIQNVGIGGLDLPSYLGAIAKKDDDGSTLPAQHIEELILEKLPLRTDWRLPKNKRAGPAG